MTDLHTQTKVIAHRGASAEAPENTLLAIQKALDIETDVIEFDIRLTQDGIPVVIHDEDFVRTTNATHKFLTEEVNLDHIKTLNASSWFGSFHRHEQIPTLEEVLHLNWKDTRVMMELKKGKSHPKHFVKSVLEIVKNSFFHMKDKLIMGSFDPIILQEIKSQAPEIESIGILENLEMIQIYQKMDINHLAIWHRLIDEKLLEHLHHRGFKVWAFTVDHESLATSFSSMNIDGIITNDPRKIIKHLKG
jgi:glycerophosphoryl diester phosphodiesterase